MFAQYNSKLPTPPLSPQHLFRCVSHAHTHTHTHSSTVHLTRSTPVRLQFGSLQDFRQLCALTLLFDLADLAHRLFEDGTFVWFDVEAVDVAEVGRDQFRQLLYVFALLLPSLPLTPAEDNEQRLKPS